MLAAARHRIIHAGMWLVVLVVLGSVFATEARADGRLCSTAFTLSFGNRTVGTSASLGATISNCGDQSWTFTDVSSDPATGPEFRVNSSCATGMTMPPGASCVVTIVFAPTIAGQTSGGLWLRNTTADSDELLTFYARGVDAQAGTATLSFVPAFATFGPQVVGMQSPLMTIELHNQGPAALTLTAMVLNGPQVYDFAGFEDGCEVGTSIPTGQSCAMELYFHPQGIGTRLANLVIDSPQLSSLAILQVSGTGTTAPSNTVTLVEYYNAALDHYFMTSLAPEIAALDSGAIAGWVRTGQSFNAYAAPVVDADPVCRFYLPAPRDAHFFTASPVECGYLTGLYPTFVLESQNAFYIPSPDTTTGACPGGTTPVYRLYNNRPDTDHRFTTDPAIRAQMVARGYLPEGYGPDAVIMCAPG
ncbi:MAG TPA: choice-of-anchor D domain-containing protein [Casimicrobiaceae bacterium]|jgi:hypothetical protein